MAHVCVCQYALLLNVCHGRCNEEQLTLWWGACCPANLCKAQNVHWAHRQQIHTHSSRAIPRKNSSRPYCVRVQNRPSAESKTNGGFNNISSEAGLLQHGGQVHRDCNGIRLCFFLCCWCECLLYILLTRWSKSNSPVRVVHLTKENGPTNIYTTTTTSLLSGGDADERCSLRLRVWRCFDFVCVCVCTFDSTPDDWNNFAVEYWWNINTHTKSEREKSQMRWRLGLGYDGAQTSSTQSRLTKQMRKSPYEYHSRYAFSARRASFGAK